MNQTLKQLKNGLLDQNPVLVMLLGMCPALATSTSLENAAGMGLAATVVLVGSNTVVSLLRRLIPQKVRIASFVVIIAAFVTAVDYLLQAYLPDLSESLGVFIPLIVVNCIILARAEAYAFKNSVGRSAMDGLSMGLGFASALMAVAAIRELLGEGSLFGRTVLPDFVPSLPIMTQPAGGFLTLGLAIAVMQKLMRRKGGVV